MRPRASTRAASASSAVAGASALLAALAGAGLPTDRFLFAGFPPPKSAGRRGLFEELKGVRAMADTPDLEAWFLSLA